jgi:transketolase
MDETPQHIETCINTIRFLAADAIQKAKSGHPGMPLGAAPAAYALWMRHLKHNPADPAWMDRDRFVLSAGHASMLLYALLHLTGYALSLDDLKNFRQWDSLTPGHPERGRVPGVEVTTGPLGQGISHAVGMAVAEAHLAAVYNRPDHAVIDHFTYVMAGDGDLMEGVTAEACALAGHLGLGKLICLYDDNRISLAGSTALTFTEDIAGRFTACGWQVLRVAEGGDWTAVDRALAEAKADLARPTLIAVRTVIGYGAPCKAGTADCHGAPLGEDELKGARERLGWPLEPPFFVPDDVREHFRGALRTGQARQADWQARWDRYRAAYPEAAAELLRAQAGELPAGWEAALPAFADPSKEVATRKASEAVLQSLAPKLPELIGGSADLNPSVITWLKGCGDFQRPDLPAEGVQGRVGGVWGYAGRNIHFGVREHAMAAIAGGIACHGGLIPYASTFFTFADYMRPSIRLAALMELGVIYVFTHDSIGVGEDGPTHQPVEHVMTLRAVPNLTVIRPADAAETVEAWRLALLNRRGPTALILTRQNLPVRDRTELAPASGLRRGGYVLWEASAGQPDVILIGTGSEGKRALAAGRTLAAEGIRARVVSLPSWDLFDRQPAAWRDAVLPPGVTARVAVEAGIRLGWEHYTGLKGAIVGMDTFGASAPAPVLFEKFGITAERVIAEAKRLLA